MDNNATTLLSETAALLAALPNAFVVSDDHALRLSDVAGRMVLAGTFFDGVVARGSVADAQGFVKNIELASTEIARLAGEIPARIAGDEKKIENRHAIMAHLTNALNVCIAAHKSPRFHLEIIAGGCPA